MYIEKPIDKLKANFNSRKNKSVGDFQSLEFFLDWYYSEPKLCYYCGITEQECQEIIVTGKLTSARFPINGKLERGRSRGMWLEIDRKKPNGPYSNDNCVLCCYFCNNDKSDVFYGDDYKDFIKDRPGYLRNLLKK